jgi:hypothetical protein
MYLGNLTRTRPGRKIVAVVLFAAVMGGVTSATNRSVNALPDEWDEVLNTARAVLAKMPDAGRIEATVKDPALRDAILGACRELKACSKVSRDQTSAVKQATLAGFERAFKTVQTEAERSDYKSCASKCRTEGTKCGEECAAARKKLCACKLTEFGQFVTRCLFG